MSYSLPHSYAPVGAGFGSLLQPSHVGEIGLASYLATMRQPSLAFVERLSRATVPIFNQYGAFQGNGVAIAPSLVMTCKHCSGDNPVIFGVDLVGKVIFNGSVEPFYLDFTILKVEGAAFESVALDADPAVGQSIQMYFKEVSGSLQQHVRSFESDSGPYGCRSDIASSKTTHGESGAPRMSLHTGFVHAIHQGESEALKVHDIYTVLEHAANDPHSPQSNGARSVLNSIAAENLATRHMYTSSIVLEQGSVSEEKARVNGEVKVSFKESSAVFGYTEIGEGRGNRWVSVHVKGQKNTQTTYAIAPNPHDNSKYNNGGQAGFYKLLARAIGGYRLEHKAYPGQGSVKALGIEYTLTET